MASKKASSASPVSAWMARASAGEVRGPVATMTLSQSGGGSPRSLPGDLDQRMRLQRALPTAAAILRGRPRARRRPAACWRRPRAMTSEAARRISSCSSPTAFVSHSSERNEFEQTARRMRRSCAPSVVPYGPHLVQHDRHAGCAICQAASLPASRRRSHGLVAVTGSWPIARWVEPPGQCVGMLPGNG